MEWRFSIEAKSFCFSIKEGFSDLHLEERRKKFRRVHFCELSMLRLVDGHGGSGESSEGGCHQVLP